jgi:hypothetical protein
MLAHGFSIDMMAELIDLGLATAQSGRFVTGSCQGGRARVRITEAGRRALSDQVPARSTAEGVQAQSDGSLRPFRRKQFYGHFFELAPDTRPAAILRRVKSIC